MIPVNISPIPVHRLRYGEIEEIAKRYFEDKFGRADSFYSMYPLH